MSLFTAWCINHPILLSKEGIGEHIETILLINGTGLNHDVPLSQNVQSSEESGWLPPKQSPRRKEELSLLRVQLPRECRLSTTENY